MSTIKTPRGTFKIAFESLVEAEAHGYTLWFTHNEVPIVTDGTRAFAVRG